MWFIGVEVEQETSAPPPKKIPGSAPAWGVDSSDSSVPSKYFRERYFDTQTKCIKKVHFLSPNTLNEISPEAFMTRKIYPSVNLAQGRKTSY